MAVDSILDKIIENKINTSLASINPINLVNDLFLVLNPRERDVLNKRFALLGDDKRYTLEKIGQGLSVTRERVRQIEISSIKKIKKHKREENNLKQLEELVVALLSEHGGVMAKHHLLENILQHVEDSANNKTVLDFVISKVLNDRVTTKDRCNRFLPYWSLLDTNLNETESIVKELIEILDTQEAPVPLDQVRDIYTNLDNTAYDHLAEKLLLTYLHISQKTKADIFGNWGLIHWNTITPKRISDKIYIVLKQYGKPMHFTEIANMINKMKFDRKTAYPATVHNELILNDKYVLIGRGIYALAEWGYQPGVVADVVKEIITKEGPLTREQIVKKVLEQRIVGKSTIHLALMNKDLFTKLGDNRYSLT